MNYAVIFAGGVGRRMKTNGVPKQFLKINDKPILVYTLEVFQNCPHIDKIVLVSVASGIDLSKKLIKQYNIDKVIDVIPGGSTGQESIFEGINFLRDIAKPEDTVLIHDGVRPVIDDELILKNIECVEQFGNSISCSPAIETIAKFDQESSVITDIIPRADCMIAKAPQCFKYENILNYHDKARAEHINDMIDSATLAKHYGEKLHFVESSPMNIKITTPYDFYVFKAILETRLSMDVIGV